MSLVTLCCFCVDDVLRACCWGDIEQMQSIPWPRRWTRFLCCCSWVLYYLFHISTRDVFQCRLYLNEHYCVPVRCLTLNDVVWILYCVCLVFRIHWISTSHNGMRSSADAEAEHVVEAVTDADAEQVRDVLGVTSDLRSHKHASKPSAKPKKRTADRKRKGSSWYNVRSAKIYYLVISFLLFCCFLNALTVLVGGQ